MNKKELLDIIEKLKKAGLLTNSDAHEKVIKRFKEKKPAVVQFILTNGIPQGINHCRECKENLSTDQFSYYKLRVDSKGFLMRSNALCSECSKKSNKDRKAVLDEFKDSIPDKPKSGTRCPKCQRAWSGNWHRHHDKKTKQFIEWLCGNCNMALQDQRNFKISSDT